MTLENHPAAQSSAAVTLFQRAHGRMTTLQRIDDQIAALLDQRKKVLDELRQVQGQINEEFDRVIRSNVESAGQLLSQVADEASRGHTHVPRLEVEETAA